MRSYTLYKHIFPNGKLYFVITSHPVQERWRKDGSGYKNNALMWKAINKYGWDNIQHIILFENLSEEQANMLEEKYINTFNTQDPNYGYNIRAGGLVVSGWRHTEEAKKKMSEKLKGRKLLKAPWNKGIHYGKKPVFQYDLEGNFIQKYNSCHDASVNLNIPEAGIFCCVENNCKTYYGFTFSRELLSKTEVLEKIASEPGTHRITIYQYNKDGQLINTFRSYKKTVQATGISKANLSDCVNGRRKTTHGYVFSKVLLTVEEVKKRFISAKRRSRWRYIIINRITNEKFLYNTIEDAANFLKIKPSVARNIFNQQASSLHKLYIFKKEPYEN